MIVLLLSAMAWASGVHIVREGDTIESIADELGIAELAPVLRGENGLAAGAQPVVGTVLELPSVPGHVDQSAVVLALRGEGTRTSPNGLVEPLDLRQTLPADSIACTEERSFATLRLASDGEAGHDDVNLMPETCVRIVAVATRGGARRSVLEVQAGSVEVRGTDVPGGQVALLSRAGVTTGDQGGFRLAMEDTGAARTEAIFGPVAVMGAGVEVAVESGQGSRTIPGEAPSPPVDLLPAGLPIAPAEGAVLLRADFGWTPVPGALGYRLQIASAPDFSDIVFASEIPQATWEAEALMLPYRVSGHWWRITSFDLTGFEGPPSDPRRFVLPQGIGR